MQNRYVGDVADFGKHGLLRFLSGMTDPTVLEPDLRLGLVWYMFPDECGNRHGGITGYLKDNPKNQETYHNCDPPLWELLKGFVDKGVRCVHCVQKNPPLPGNTLYYGAPLHFPPYMLRSIRKNVRGLWLAGALQATEKARLVCLDPDNGITPEAKMHLKQGPKFTYLSDLREFWDRGQSLVVYHHLPMDKLANDAIREKADLLGHELGQEPISLRYHRGSARVFFVVPKPEHKELIEDRVGRFLERGWEKHGHFERKATGAVS